MGPTATLAFTDLALPTNADIVAFSANECNGGERLNVPCDNSRHWILHKPVLYHSPSYDLTILFTRPFVFRVLWVQYQCRLDSKE